MFLDEFLKAASSKSKLNIVDLAKSPPDLMNSDTVTAYVKRNLKNQILSDSEKKHLEIMDKFYTQIDSADYLVLAFPIYNFFMPGLIKLWIDNVTQAGKTFTSTEYGPKGLWNGKQALVINTSGSTLKESALDFSTPYLKFIFKYWGLDEAIFQGLFALRFSGVMEEKVSEFRTQIQKIVSKWYG
jgi:FMN-dependent NADH-azoreductase